MVQPAWAQQRQRVQEVVDGYPMHAIVRGYDIRIEDTWDGEPGAWVLLHTPARGSYSKTDIRAFLSLVKDLRARVRQVVPDREVYVSFIADPTGAA